MKNFVHSAPWSNVTSLEFLRTLKKMAGVSLGEYGYENGYFQVHFSADKEAEVFLKLRYTNFFSEKTW